MFRKPNLLTNAEREAAKSALSANKSKPDIINHPPHYQSECGLEVIDVIEAFCANLQGVEATDTGNIIKYACRWKKKNGVEDLKKIIWYAQHLIKHLKKKEETKHETIQ